MAGATSPEFDRFHQRIRALFDAALERPASERADFLAVECAGDGALQQEVLRLLAMRDRAGSFLQTQSERIGRYVILRELGRGAMGIVSEALDPLIGRNIAVKVIRPETLGGQESAGLLRDRLFREASSSGKLSHPNIVTIHDVGQDGDRAFIAMELVRGCSLQSLMQSESSIDRRRLMEVLRQTARALDHAHRNDVVHRDIKPANIMLDEEGNVKITDFGIAKAISASNATLTGFGVGTPSYMSPEQIQARELDGKSDQFSLAVMAYRMLTGNLPFRAEPVAALLHAIMHGERPSAREANPSLSPAVDKVLKRGLAREPGSRYGTCGEFLEALDSAVRIAPPRDLLPKSGISREGNSRRRRLFAAIACLSIIGLAVSLYVATRRPRIAPTNSPAVAAPLPQQIQVAATSAPPEPGSGGASGGTKPDPKEMFEEAESAPGLSPGEKLALLRRSAKLGYAAAMNEIGQIYLTTDADTAVVTREEAVAWLRQAAQTRSTSAMVTLGVMYLLGKGVDRDPRMAANWFQKAADAGDSAGMYNLGRLYEDGADGITPDPARARALYRQAAIKGNANAKTRLADIR